MPLAEPLTLERVIGHREVNSLIDAGLVPERDPASGDDLVRTGGQWRIQGTPWPMFECSEER